jgi:hypothetical protein
MLDDDGSDGKGAGRRSKRRISFFDGKKRSEK